MRRLRIHRRTPSIGLGYARATSGRGRGTLSFPTLSITQQPTSATDNAVFSPPIIVHHPNGALGAGQTCTAAIYGAGPGVLVGLVTAVFDSVGDATFSSQAIHQATKVAITTQPAGAVDEQPLTTQMTGTIQDDLNVVIAAPNVIVQLNVNAGSRIGTNTVVTDAAGAWSFVGSGFGLNVTAPPTPVIITANATAAGLTSAVANSITVT